MLGTNTAGTQNQFPDFEVMIKDIDDAINTKPIFSNSKVGNSESSLAMIGKDLHFGSNGSITKDLGSPIQILKKEEGKLTTQISKMPPTEVKLTT